MNYCIECKHCVQVDGSPFGSATNPDRQAFCDLARDPVYRLREKCESVRSGPPTDKVCGESGYYWMARE